jgi:serine protease Do
MTSLLDELTNSGHEIARAVGPSVVGVGRRGTGVVVAPGLVATNAHNVTHGKGRHDEVEVSFADGRVVTAEVRASDLDGDLAVLSVDTADAPPIEWSDSTPEPGDAVFALANPGGRGSRLSFGIVSSVGRGFRGPRGRRIAGSLEHTAPLARGSSGGPVLDRTGRAIGLNTHRLGEGFYLALPVDEKLRGRLDDLAEGTVPTRRSLGVAVVPPRVARRLRAAVGLPDHDGLLVRAVDPDGPGARAGLREGDLIVEAGGRPITSVDDLHALLDDWSEPTCSLHLLRGTEAHTVEISFE